MMDAIPVPACSGQQYPVLAEAVTGSSGNPRPLAANPVMQMLGNQGLARNTTHFSPCRPMVGKAMISL
jgi:hypothetical protein